MSPRWLALVASSVLAVGVGACGEDEDGGGAGNLSGKIAIDGSSTVGPLAQAAAEEFQGQNPDVRVSVGTSGTGGGFEKFCAGEIDIADASRPIKDDEEVPVCRKNNVAYREVQVANDGIAVASNKAVRINCMTVAQLRELWATDEVESYDEIDPEFPDVSVSLFGPGTDSGTFEFFTEEINGEEGRTRKDYQPSEDDNVLVQGVEGDEGGLGYFGFSYYESNADRLNLVAVDDGDGCVRPSTKTIQDGSYKPLSRPLFMYVRERALRRPEVKAFMSYVLDNQNTIARASQIVPNTAAQVQKGKQALQGAGAGAG